MGCAIMESTRDCALESTISRRVLDQSLQGETSSRVRWDVHPIGATNMRDTFGKTRERERALFRRRSSLGKETLECARVLVRTQVQHSVRKSLLEDAANTQLLSSAADEQRLRHLGEILRDLQSTLETGVLSNSQPLRMRKFDELESETSPERERERERERGRV